MMPAFNLFIYDAEVCSVCSEILGKAYLLPSKSHNRFPCGVIHECICAFGVIRSELLNRSHNLFPSIRPVSLFRKTEFSNFHHCRSELLRQHVLLHRHRHLLIGQVFQRFTPPTIQDVKAYIIEKGYHIDAERFIDYYEANGWKVGRNPMKDWKATVRNWARQDKKADDMSVIGDWLRGEQ